MAVNLKLGVELGNFQQNINTAKAQIKEFDAALKQAESRFKATGDAESAMATKTSQLTAKLQAQKRMVDEYRQALQKADENGVSKLNSEYIKLQTQMLNAEAAMYDTQAALQSLSMSEQEAAKGADTLTKSVNGISKKISLDQVIGGINTITSGLENAARKAVDLGEKLWNMIMDSAQRAGDQAEMAQMYEIPLQRYKQMLGLEAAGLKTTTDAIISSQKKLNKNIGSGSTATLETLRELGLLFETGKGAETFITTDTVEMFWKAGQALMAMDKSFDKEAAAQSLFGRSWEELIPLFTSYKSLEEYNAALEDVQVTSEETTQNLDELADEVGKLQNTWTTLKDEIIGAVAEPLTKAAGALDDVLSTVLEYLQTEEGKAMLDKLGESVAGLFEDLSKINPDDVVNNFVTIFDKLTDGLEWMSNNWDGVVTGIEAIGAAFGLLKISEGVLEFLKLISGAKTLLGSGSSIGTGGGGGLLGGAGGKLLATGAGLGLNGALATGAAALTMFDPTGLTAIIPSVLEDQTAFLRTLRNGGSLEEAAAESGKAVEQAFNGAKKAWEDWGNDIIEVPKKLAQSIWKDLFGGGNDEPKAEVKVEPKTDEEAAAMISAQIGTVSVPVRLVIQGGNSSKGPNGALGIGGGGGGMMDYYYEQVFGGFATGFANGIPWVPDTMLAWLHPGERVLTARENRNYTANSNLYIENMNMGGGMDAAGLAAAMAAQNRRISAGFGS